MDTKEFINKDLIYAVVGASNDREKYGNKVFRDLKAAGYNVIPINLKEDTIEGYKAHHFLTELTIKPHIVIFTIPPKATLSVLIEMKGLNLRKAWFQPGSESEEAKDYCEKNGIANIMGKCIMVERRNLGV
jgi:predicted CoA-binding protein